MRESMAINVAGFWAVHEAYEPGRTQAELMAAAEAVFARLGTGRQTMDMVLWGQRGLGDAGVPNPRSADADRGRRPAALLARGGRARRPLGGVLPPPDARARSAPTRSACSRPTASTTPPRAQTMRAGASAHDVHRAVSAPFADRGYPLGHVTGHSIGMTMIEHPRIGEGIDVELREGMVFSMHPHAIADGASALPVHAGHLVHRRGRRRAARRRGARDLRRQRAAPDTRPRHRRELSEMLLAATDYVRPRASRRRSRRCGSNAGARVLAGGQTLINVLKHRAASVELLVDVSRLEELRFIDVRADGSATIGAASTYAELERSAPLRDAQPLIGEVAAGDGRSPGARARDDRGQRVLRRSGLQLSAAAGRARRLDGDRRPRRAPQRARVGVLPRHLAHGGRSRASCSRRSRCRRSSGAGVGYSSLQRGGRLLGARARGGVGARRRRDARARSRRFASCWAAWRRRRCARARPRRC